MAPNNEYIEQLILEKLSGSISKDDNQLLEELIKNNTAVHNKWEELKETIGNTYLQDIDSENAWDSVQKKLKTKHLYHTTLPHLNVAATITILILLAGGFYLYTQFQNRIASTEKHQKYNIKLLVNNSESINLSDYSKKNVSKKLHHVNLNINQSGLKYTAQPQAVSESLNTLIIPPTKIYHITLSDGTKVTLNSMSELKFPFKFSKNKREVFVKGEAFFKIKKDKDKPFIVHTPATTIQVLGTSFNVNTYNKKTKTSLAKGKVRTISNSDDSLLLQPGQASLLSLNGTFKKVTTNIQKDLSWMGGIYYFRNKSLNDLATIIYRWYGQKLIFDSSQTAGIKFTGAIIKRKPLQFFLSNLSSTSNLQFYREKDKIHIKIK